MRHSIGILYYKQYSFLMAKNHRLVVIGIRRTALFVALLGEEYLEKEKITRKYEPNLAITNEIYG